MAYRFDQVRQIGDEMHAAIASQKIKWSRIRAGVYWGVAPVGLAYQIERTGKVDGEWRWELKEFPNEDAETFEHVDVGTLRDLKNVAVLEAACHVLNIKREVR